MIYPPPKRQPVHDSLPPCAELVIESPTSSAPLFLRSLGLRAFLPTYTIYIETYVDHSLHALNAALSSLLFGAPRSIFLHPHSISFSSVVDILQGCNRCKPFI